jgi:hypothetical protein
VNFEEIPLSQDEEISEAAGKLFLLATAQAPNNGLWRALSALLAVSAPSSKWVK